MTTFRKVELGVLLAAALAVISFTFWLGGLSQKVATLEERIGKLEATCDQRAASPEPVDGGFQSPTLPGPAVTLALASDVDPQHAAFTVEVTGTVAGATRLYTYIVVDDGNAEWIQPGLGYNRDGVFHSRAYLGEAKGEASLNKSYSVFAVITSSQHNPYQHLVAGSVKARTEPIRLHRTR